MGVENLRIIIETTGATDEDHARNAVRFEGVEDCWVKDVTALHFTYAGVDTRASNRVTVLRCTAIEPHSEITGGRRYNFATGRLTNSILFEKCHGSFGRHTFVSNGASESSGIVFYDCTSDNDLASSEGHRRWSTGMLFDNITFTNSQTSRVIALYNRGDFGTGHGWSVAHSTLWRVIAPSNAGIIVQKPPLRQNYAIASDGNYSVRPPFPQHPGGYIEHANEPSKSYAIPSLYEKQLDLRIQGRNVIDPAARLTSRIGETGKIVLQWFDISAEETGYLIEIKTEESEEFQFLDQVEPNETEYVHEISENLNGNLVYRVQTMGLQCGSPYSNPAFVEITTNTKEVYDSKAISFPNPFQEYFEVSKNIDYKSLIIYTISGRQVKINYSSSGHIDSAGWSPGIYLASCQDKQGKTRSFKLVKLP